MPQSSTTTSHFSSICLSAADVAQSYSDQLVFSGVSFSVSAGEALVVTGDNGSGKSTLLKTLAGLMPPTAGTVTLAGAAEDTPLAEQCHLVGFANALKNELTAHETLAQWRDILGAGEGSTTIEAALAALGLGGLAHTPAGFLSTGLKRRLALARILVARRPVWFLDEPTAALDLASSRLVAEMIRKHLQTGGLAVIATHLDLGIDGLKALDLDAHTAARA